MKHVQEIADRLVNLTVKEVNELATILREEHGIEPAAAAAPVVVAEAPEKAETPKTTFDVILKSVLTSKINVIKAVRNHTNSTLKEAKELVDNAPKPVKQGLSKEEAENIKNQLEEAGAEVVLK